MSMVLILWSVEMLNDILVSTNNQKILQFLSKYSDKEFHEREIVRRLGTASGSANRALNELFAAGAVTRRTEFQRLFYSVDISNPGVVEFKKLVNVLLLEPLVEKLKPFSTQVALFGSCAQGTDTSKSDMDIFIVTGKKEKVNQVMQDFQFSQGYEGIVIQPIIKTPVELLNAGESERAFLSEVEKGITLWEKRGSDES
jgi:predicted nucleotidyltransferase